MFDCEVIDNQILLATELLKGETLCERMKSTSLTEEEAMGLFRQILKGIDVLHRSGMDLQELRPDQLVFREDGSLSITHVALFNKLHALSDITGEWDLASLRPIYTTPEMIHSHKANNRSDLYLAAVIGYEMLTGQPPYATGTLQDILYAHAAQPVPNLPDPRHPLNSLIKQMLSKLPEQRPESAAAVLSKLNELYPELA